MYRVKSQVISYTFTFSQQDFSSDPNITTKVRGLKPLFLNINSTWTHEPRQLPFAYLFVSWFACLFVCQIKKKTAEWIAREKPNISGFIFRCCSLNKTKGKLMHRPGIEPASTAWKAAMLTTIPPTLTCTNTVEKILRTRQMLAW